MRSEAEGRVRRRRVVARHACDVLCTVSQQAVGGEARRGATVVSDRRRFLSAAVQVGRWRVEGEGWRVQGAWRTVEGGG